MRQSIFLILLLCFSKLYGQSEEVFPDYQEITKDKIISEVVWTDEVSGNKVKTSYLENGIIRKEVYSDYKKAFSKYSIDGSFQYKYNGLTFPIERFYTNSKEDTLKVLYSYKDNKIVKRAYWEYERRSKMRKGAPKYGDGTPAGCIVAEQDLIRYRKWVKAKFKVTVNRIKAESKALTDLKTLRNKATQEKGQAQEATRLRNEKLDDLADYCTELKAIAEIALESQPQLLEKLGILVRS